MRSALGLLLHVTELGSLLPGSMASKVRCGLVASVALLRASQLVGAGLAPELR